MNHNRSQRLLFSVAYLSIVVGVLVATPVLSPEANAAELLWKNGDVLPGELLENDGDVLRWQAESFPEPIRVSTNAIRSVVLDSPKSLPRGQFRIVLSDGTTLTADLVSANKESLGFKSDHLGNIQINTSQIETIDPVASRNLAFDGSQFSNWRPAVKFPIERLTYRVYQSDEKWWQRWPDFGKLSPVSQGRLDSGKLNIRVADIQGQHGIRFDGTFVAPQDGEYRFDISVDDLANLYVDEQLVSSASVGRDTWKRVALTAGPHAIRLDFIEFGIAARLSLKVEGPGLPQTELADQQHARGWYQTKGGNAATDSRTTLHRAMLLPDRFEMEMELKSSASPQFVIGFGPNRDATLNNEAPRLKTRSGALVLIHANKEQTIAESIDEKTSVQFTIRYDGTKRTISALNRAGEVVTQIDGIDLPAGVSGIAVRNKGTDLRVQRLRVYEIGPNDSFAPSTAAPQGLVQLRLSDGDLWTGEFQVANNSAAIIQESGARQEIALSQIERIRLPRLASKSATSGVEVSYSDGTLVRGEINKIKAKSIVLNVPFQADPIVAARAGLSRIEFQTPTSTSEPQNETNVYDQLLMTDGRFQGKVTFGQGGEAIGWRPEGSLSVINVLSIGPALVQREIDDSALPYQSAEYPHRIYLKDGQNFSCFVTSCDNTTTRFQSSFLTNEELTTDKIKAFEFETMTRDAEARTPSERFLPHQELTHDELERALTVPRFQRDSPFTHLFLARNGDLRRGSLKRFQAKTIKYSSKLKQFSIPVSRLAGIINVESSTADTSHKARTPEHNLTLVTLTDGTRLRLEVTESTATSLIGIWSLGAQVNLPTEFIHSINIDGYETDLLTPRYQNWIAVPAPEPTISAE